MRDATKPQEAITAAWKIHDVLQRYPQMLDVLVALSPAFGKLRNPLLRRVQSRLVTVEQAARIAGLDPDDLVRRLNAALGVAPAEPAPPAAPGGPARPAPAHAVDRAVVERAPVAVDLDVRPYHARGEEPFTAIMAAARQVPPGRALRLRNTFEPVPLYDVLGRQGFVHCARQLGPEDWEVLFLRAEGAAGSEAAVDPGAPSVEGGPEGGARDDARWEAPAATVTVDVSDLVPPEPMVRILEALDRLPPGETLLVQHVRRPVFLYPRLDALGYEHETRELGPGRVEIRIRKPRGGPRGEV